MPDLIEIAEDSVRGGFFLFTGNVLSLVILAVGYVVVARLLGPENYGLLALSIALSSIFSSLIDFGVDPALVRFSAKHRAEGKNCLAASRLKSGFLFKVIMGVTASAICFLFSDIIAIHILARPETVSLIRLTSILIVFQTIFMTFRSSFIGLDRMEGSALLMNAHAFTKTVLSPLLVILGLSIAGALTGHILSYLFACIVGGLLLLRLYRNLGTQSNVRFSSNLKVMIGYGFPLYLSNLLTSFLGQSQPIILAFFVSNTEIGNFSLAVTLSNMLAVLIVPLEVLFPAFSKIRPGSEDLKRIFSLSVKYAALLIVPATVIIALLSRYIVHILYGQSYSLAPSFLSFYILTFLYTGTGFIVLFYLFSGVGQTKVALRYSFINLIVFFSISPILAGLYRVPGLIAAFLISTLISLIYGLRVAMKRIKVNLDLESSLGIYAASFLSAIPTLALQHISPFKYAGEFFQLIVGGSIFIITYLTLAPITGAITNLDLENFEVIFSKNRFVRPILKQILNYEKKILSIYVKS